MRRLMMVVLAVASALTLLLSPGCKRQNLRDMPEEGGPREGPEKPPIPTSR